MRLIAYLSVAGFFILSLFWNSCDQKASQSSVKFRQYYLKGEQLYTANCINCHQRDGSGLARLYPPLDTSDFMKRNFNDVLCMIRYGKSGEIIVNDRNYNQPMPAFSQLSDIEIAELATYIYNSWSNAHGIIEVKTVTQILDSCHDN
jgi:cytochrome c551